MSKKIIWKPLPDDENKQFNVLWGENSIHRDPIISVPYNILMPGMEMTEPEDLAKMTMWEVNGVKRIILNLGNN